MAETGMREIIHVCTGVEELLFDGYWSAVSRVYALLRRLVSHAPVTVVVSGVYCSVEDTVYVVGRAWGLSLERTWVSEAPPSEMAPGGEVFVEEKGSARNVLRDMIAYITGDEKLSGKIARDVEKGKGKQVYSRGGTWFIVFDGYGYTGVDASAVPTEIEYDGRVLRVKRPSRLAEIIGSLHQPLEKYMERLQRLLKKQGATGEVMEEIRERLLPNRMVYEYLMWASTTGKLWYPESPSYAEVIKEYLVG